MRDWLSEHLHRLDLLFNFQIWQLDVISNFYIAREYSASHYSSLTLDLEAMIQTEEELLVT